jgi:hypothetical protein
VQQGINLNNATAQGFGQNDPVASNATAAGRQQNRRVEMVVSGEPIGDTASAQGQSSTPGQQPEAQPTQTQPQQPQSPPQMPQTQQQPELPH